MLCLWCCWSKPFPCSQTGQQCCYRGAQDFLTPSWSFPTENVSSGSLRIIYIGLETSRKGKTSSPGFVIGSVWRPNPEWSLRNPNHTLHAERKLFSAVSQHSVICLSQRQISCHYKTLTVYNEGWWYVGQRILIQINRRETRFGYKDGKNRTPR